MTFSLEVIGFSLCNVVGEASGLKTSCRAGSNEIFLEVHTKTKIKLGSCQVVAKEGLCSLELENQEGCFLQEDFLKVVLPVIKEDLIRVNQVNLMRKLATPSL